MKIKTRELTGAALDWAVAKCEAKEVVYLHRHRRVWYDPMGGNQFVVVWSPSTDWSQGGPIIEREKYDLECWGGPLEWRASYNWLGEPHFEGFGSTALIAAMRCFVASRLGDEVDVPKELLP